MRILIKRAQIVDHNSRHHNKKRDVLIRDEVIEQIGRSLDVSFDEAVEIPGLHISPGWCDIGTQIGEPGFEQRETIESVARAAAAGGYTAIASFPNTHPVLDTRSAVEYVRKRSDHTAVRVHPIGAVTQGAKGKDISELQDMRTAGALAFSDGRRPIDNAGIMLLALNYVKTFDGLVINRVFDPALSTDAQMHEGAMSTSLGMRGFPTVSERISLERDLKLLEYSDSRLHVYGISSADSVRLLKSARKKGQKVSSSAVALNLLLTDESLAEFDTNLKVQPPLRTEKDRKALVKGVANGTIDAISSNHEPYEEEGKKLEFANAQFGSTGLETTFAIANSALRQKTGVERIVECLCHGPRNILGLPIPTIEEGNNAELALFLPDREWTVRQEDLRSKSRNCAVIGRKLTGFVVGTCLNGTLHLNNSFTNKNTR